jgi:hypothetical protein
MKRGTPRQPKIGSFIQELGTKCRAFIVRTLTLGLRQRPQMLVTNLVGHALTEEDYRSLEERWISLGHADAALLRRADNHLGVEMTGQQGRPGYYSGILIPYIWPGEDSVRDYRLRRDRPDMEQDAGGNLKPRRKYLAPPGRGNMLYLPPQADAWLLKNLGIPLVIVEGELKMLALWRLAWHHRGDTAEDPAFLPVGLQGVYSWRGIVGKTTDAHGERVDVRGPIPDLGRLEWADRYVTLVFDADVMRNLDVSEARRRLTDELEDRGAVVAWLQWPDGVPANRKGIDDYLAAYGPDQVARMLSQSKVVTRRRKRVATEISAEWQRELLCAEKGPLPILANAITALKLAPEWKDNLFLNEFSQQIGVVRGTPWNRGTTEWNDTDDILLAEWLQRNDVRVSVPIANQAVQAVARLPSLHPVREYLCGLKWDGVKRIDEWLPRYFGAPDTPFVRAAGSKWLVSAVARIMQPGCKVDHCLVLEGPQGDGKSTGLNILAGDDWFSDNMSDLGSKDSAIDLQGVWTIEFA